MLALLELPPEKLLAACWHGEKLLAACWHGAAECVADEADVQVGVPPPISMPPMPPAVGAWPVIKMQHVVSWRSPAVPTARPTIVHAASCASSSLPCA